MSKLERTNVIGNQEIYYPKGIEDWKECWKWYKSHGFRMAKFVDWLAYMTTQSVEYMLKYWELYAFSSMEEMAFRCKYTKEEILNTRF